MINAKRFASLIKMSHNRWKIYEPFTADQEKSLLGDIASVKHIVSLLVIATLVMIIISLICK
jgi:hypothetical protein